MDVEIIAQLNQHLIDIKYLLFSLNFFAISFYIYQIFKLIYKMFCWLLDF